MVARVQDIEILFHATFIKIMQNCYHVIFYILRNLFP